MTMELNRKIIKLACLLSLINVNIYGVNNKDRSLENFKNVVSPSVVYDQYGWSQEGINKETGTKYNKYGWDRNGINKKTGTKYNKNGWTIDNKNKKTGTKYDRNGFDINGINKETGTKYNRKGLDVFGGKKAVSAPKSEYDQYGWNSQGINKETGTKYNIYGWNKNSINEKTGTKYNVDGWTIDNKNKETGTKYDSQGFDIFGVNKNGEKKGSVGKQTSYNEIPISTLEGNGLNIHQNTNIINKDEQEKLGFINTRLSFSNETEYMSHYSGANAPRGNFSDEEYFNNQLEFYTQKDTLGYSVFVGKREEGKFYDGESYLDETYYGGKILKFFPGKGFVYGGIKLYNGKSDGYFTRNGDYISRNSSLKEDKTRWEFGGYFEEKLYFLNGYYGGDSPEKSNGIYEKGNYGGIELGKKIPHKDNYIVPSIEYYGEDYESYSFYEVWLKLGYQFNYSKGYITPFFNTVLVRDQNNDDTSLNYTINTGGKFRIGVKGNHRINEEFGLTYAIFWQDESRDYPGNDGGTNLIMSYVSIDYFFN